MQKALRDRRTVVVIVAVFALLVASFAVVAQPADAAVSYGDMVEYDMAFPVAGDPGLRDTFGACRDGCSRRHEGQDLFAPKRTKVFAVAAGTVRYVNWSTSQGLNPSRCCSVVIDHADGWQSRYIHMNNDSPGTDDGKGFGIAKHVKPGAKLKAGQHIGSLGDSGNAENTAPHLHFELRAPNGTVVNPYEALLAAKEKRDGAGGAEESEEPAAEPDDALFSSTAALRRGDRGSAVEELQGVLNELGYAAGTADGVFGKKTEAAVRAFQEDQGLKADGIAGKNTKAALEKELAPRPTVRRGDRSDDVAVMQGLLNDAGYNAGKADGVFGKRTESAVKAFQKDAGLKADGIVGKNTWAALRSA